MEDSITDNQTDALTVADVARFLKIHPESVRRMAVSGKIPGIKLGGSWRFLKEDLVKHIRSQYVDQHALQGVVTRSNQKWHSTKEKTVASGGWTLPTREKEYVEALGLATN